MKILIRNTVKKMMVISPIVDFALAIMSVPIALILWVFTRVSPNRLPLTTKTFKKLKVFPIRDHYYQPLFNHSRLRRPLDQDRNLPGIDLNTAGQLDLLDNLAFADELATLNLDNRKKMQITFWTSQLTTVGSKEAMLIFCIKLFANSNQKK